MNHGKLDFQITKELKRHAAARHEVTGKSVDTLFRLMCVGCSEKFELDAEIKDWDEHMARQPCRYSRSRSRTR